MSKAKASAVSAINQLEVTLNTLREALIADRVAAIQSADLQDWLQTDLPSILASLAKLVAIATL